MKKIIILLFIVFGCTIRLKAQEGFLISGKMDGISDGILLLMSDEKGKPDTLATTQIVKGAFVFTGTVDTPVAAYITTANSAKTIPLILENATFMINVNNSGALIKGGQQQEIYNRFSELNTEILSEQSRIQKEYDLAGKGKDKAKQQALTGQFEETLASAQQREKELLKQYADTYVAAHFVATGAEELELEALKTRYELLGQSAKETVPGRFVATLIEKLDKLTEGNMAPDFTVAAQAGEPLSLYLMESRLKLIVFWISGDPVSRQENVNLLNIYQKYHLRGLEIISVSGDEDRRTWVKAIGTDGMIWKNGIDNHSAVFDLYHVKTLPCTVLLDAENHIIAKNLKGNELRKKIDELLKKR